MEGEEAVIAVIEALDALGIEYMVVGSLSSNFYGVPRSTEDAGILVAPGKSSLQDAAKRVMAPSNRRATHSPAQPEADV